LQAAKAHNENTLIEAVLNDDIIGTDTSGNGRFGNTSVSVYSDETMDSPWQQLSRYAREVAERYVPSIKVDTIFMGARLGRGGDHTPFLWEGYPGPCASPHLTRSTPISIMSPTWLENMSVPYSAKVAGVNAVVAAALAFSPKQPVVMRTPPPPYAGATESAAGTPPRRPTPMISRGQSGYDALMPWKPAGPDAGIKGYTVVIRSTTSPYWEQEIYVGKVTQYLIKDVSIDDLKCGVKAIGVDGGESLVAPFLYPLRAKTEIETIQRVGPAPPGRPAGCVPGVS
jgi:hypothetical protein